MQARSHALTLPPPFSACPTTPTNVPLPTSMITLKGSRTFADLLQGYRDFLALCLEEHWTLNATKTRVGYPSCVFFGFEVDKKGTRLADKNLDPIRRMVPPSNLPELRSHAFRRRQTRPLHLGRQNTVSLR